MVAMSFGTCRRHETVAEEKAAPKWSFGWMKGPAIDHIQPNSTFHVPFGNLSIFELRMKHDPLACDLNMAIFQGKLFQ